VHVLGISGGYHDSAVAVISDGHVVSAVQEERFTRKKNDATFPVQSLKWCVEDAGITAKSLAAVVWYEKPLTKFVRVLKTFVAAGPRGLPAFPGAMDGWLRDKLWVAYTIDKALRSLDLRVPGKVMFCDHHMSHAAAAFYPSPFERAATLTFDGVGEWATSSIGRGWGSHVELRAEQHFPDSIGLLYSAFTQHCGFRVNSGEYKLMGLAPFGEPRFADEIRSEIVEISDDGTFSLNMDYFDFLAGRRTTSKKFDSLFGPARKPESEITERDCDLARSIQLVTEDIVLAIARHARDITGESDAVIAGGVGLNCVANGRLLREGPFDRLWVQPAAGDAGSSLGCALWAWHEVLGNPRPEPPKPDGMSGALLGPTIDTDEVVSWLEVADRPFLRFESEATLAERVAELIAEGAVVAVCRGRCEFGPRALGHRSILADARTTDMQQRLNLRVKKRESFRPFAPAVLAEHAEDWFDLGAESPYMTLVADVDARRWVDNHVGGSMTPEERVAQVRSAVPAITHVNHSARVQTVDATRAPWLHKVLAAFEADTGCPMLVNTSFNLRGEPIVLTAEDAYQTFIHADIDWLVLGDLLVDRSHQPPWSGGRACLELD